MGSFACNTHIYLRNSDNSETNQHSRKIYTCIIQRLFHNTQIYCILIEIRKEFFDLIG